MGKYLLGLVGVGVLAFLVKSAADDAGKKLAAVREAKAEAPAPAAVPGAVVNYDDPLGCYRVVLPGEAGPKNADSTVLHGLGRGAYLTYSDKTTRLEVSADFVGSDGLNTPRQTLTWVVKKDIVRGQQNGKIDQVKFSRTPAGVEVSEFEYEWRGNGARASRTRYHLYRKWLYTLTASGLPDGLDTPEILSFFETFALTDKALDHPDGGLLKP
jgi:hypothetical protein